MDTKSLVLDIMRRALIGAGLLLATLLVGVQMARAVEVIPSVGFSRPVDGEETKISGGLAFRAPLVPLLQTEIAVSYRSESRFNDALRVRMWPVTTSLWLTPVPALYAGGGVGFYHVTFDYDEAVTTTADETHSEFGVHLGGGLRVPLAPRTAIDLNGRYVMMRDQESRLVPERFDPDFWNAALGLAIRF